MITKSDVRFCEYPAKGVAKEWIHNNNKKWYHPKIIVVRAQDDFAKSRGKFYKTVIAGHVGTHHFWHDRHYHEMYYDGESHYYIDGSVYKGGKLILLRYDTKTGKYEPI